MSKYIVWSILVLMLAACNTIQGVGKDLEKAGEAVQRSSK